MADLKTPKDIMTVDLSFFNALSPRVYRELRRNNISTLYDLSQLTHNDLVRLRGVGTEARNEISSLLESNGVSLNQGMFDRREKNMLSISYPKYYQDIFSTYISIHGNQRVPEASSTSWVVYWSFLTEDITLDNLSKKILTFNI